MTLEQEKYISFGTYRKSGDLVASPTWIVPLDDGGFGFWTSSASGKIKRLRNDARVTVQPCDSRGRVTAGSSPLSGSAKAVSSGPVLTEIQTKVKAKYGVMVPISRLFNTLGHLGKGSFPYGDTAVVLHLDEAPSA